MNIFQHYLQKHSLYESFIDEIPSEKLGCCIVIPCYNEDSLLPVIASLNSAHKPSFDIELIIVLNGKENDTEQIKLKNKKIKEEYTTLKEKFHSESFRIYLIEVLNINPKVAGVGYARKTGMDEAIRRFSILHKQDGIIVSLDVDCTVEANYLIEIERIFTQRKANACSIRFEHTLDASAERSLAIAQYELYLHYHILALQYAGHPYAFHTIGSCFAVRADVYAKQGGMNQRQAGEDFYFLHKIIPLGRFYQLTTTCVYPSPRISNRVPFGTGIAIQKILNSPNQTYLVYNFDAYKDVKQWFNNVFAWYHSSNDEELLTNLPQIFQNYLTTIHYLHRLTEIKSNTASFSSFQKRFFRWFNVFIIIKYLNYSHEYYYQKMPVTTVIKKLLETTHHISPLPVDIIELLQQVRHLIYEPK